LKHLLSGEYFDTPGMPPPLVFVEVKNDIMGLMGIVHIKAVIKQNKVAKKKAEERFLVDTGAQYTLIPKEIVDKLALKPMREQEFILADGNSVIRKIGEAYIEMDKHQGTTTVILGEKGDSALLGTVTLDQMGLIVDPFKRELRAIKALLM